MSDQHEISSRSASEVAWLAWLASVEGRLCLTGAASGTPLRNRLVGAFHAGWFAALVAPVEAPTEE